VWFSEKKDGRKNTYYRKKDDPDAGVALLYRCSRVAAVLAVRAEDDDGEFDAEFYSGISHWFTRSRSSENCPADVLTDEDGAVAVVHQNSRNKV
jgi:hypothetical protein